MEKSSWQVYSIIKNIDIFIKTNKDVDIFKKVHFVVFKQAPKIFVENSKRIYNEIENGYYTFHDLIIFILFKYMIDGKYKLYDIKQKNVNDTIKLFTQNKLKEDLKLMKEIHKQLGFKKGIKDYFEIKEDGTNIAYILTKNQKISPLFFIRNFQKALTEISENVIIIKNKDYVQFEKIAIKIKEILTGGSDEQTKIQD